MRTRTLVALTVLGLAALVPPEVAQAVLPTPVSNYRARVNSSRRAWHGDYYHVMWGQPVALVVPPTAELQTHWSWGVAQTRVTPIWHQFRRPYPGPYVGGRGFLPTPPWPSSTDQFGVYYIRGPW